MRRRDPRYPIAERLRRLGFHPTQATGPVQTIGPSQLERPATWLAHRTTITDIGPAENPRVYRAQVAKVFEAFGPTLGVAQTAAADFLYHRMSADGAWFSIEWERAFDPGGYPTWTIRQDPQ